MESASDHDANVAPNMLDSETTRRSFRQDVRLQLNYAPDVIEVGARREPDRIARRRRQRGRTASLSADLSRRSNRVAHVLGADGVRKADRAFVMLPRIPQWYEVLLGCFEIGAAPMPATSLPSSAMSNTV